MPSVHVALFRAANLRSYRELEIRPHPRLNLIVGPNAAGKTTLLEGLHLVGRAKSFRAGNLAELTGLNGNTWFAYAEVEQDGLSHRLGAGWSDDGVQLRTDGNRAKASQLARRLPMQLIDPMGHRLIDDGPGFRRSYLDWGVFHVEQSFHEHWQRYQRALRQRNQAIRLNQTDEAVGAWDGELALSATAVTEARTRHALAVAERLPAEVARLLDVDGIRLEFHPGWADEQDYRQLLEKQLPQHRRMGSTLQGPHRAELKLWVGGRRAKGRVSRGQQKLLVAALVLAQCQILIEAGRPAPVILVDDFGAELSDPFQERLASALTQYPGQVFISAFEPPPCFEGQELHLFHVEQGRCQPHDSQRDNE